MKKNFLLLLTFFVACIALANPGIPAIVNNDDGLKLVAVGEASFEQEKIAINFPESPPDLSAQEKQLIDRFLEILSNDFLFYRKFFELDKAYTRNRLYSWSELKSNKLSFAINLNFSRLTTTPKELGFQVTLDLYSVLKNTKLDSFSRIVRPETLRQDVHTMANLAYQKITGRESIFKSKIVFVSDKNARGRDYIKELYMMDFDGGNQIQLTNHRATVVSPAISNDKNLIVYTLISKRGKTKTNDLFLLDLRTSKSIMISSFPGINSGAVFLPGDEKILLTLSKSGNSEIYELDLKSKALRQITQHWAEDVDPSITEDGKQMAFLSSRSRKAEIFTADPSSAEKSVKRISYVGKFNATPRFSPDGKEIVFSSWLDERFDLFRITADGTGLVRLTKDFGSNEDPTYSPDGEFIAFTSQRILSRSKAIQNVYIMDKDGEILGQITEDMGNCIGPRWSK